MDPLDLYRTVDPIGHAAEYLPSSDPMRDQFRMIRNLRRPVRQVHLQDARTRTGGVDSRDANRARRKAKSAARKRARY